MTSVRATCGGGAAELMCLISCNLGCASSGCSINQIAQNQPIELIFSQDVDKFSVPPHTTSILLRTASGEEPVGDWLVNGNRVTFVPGVLISGAKTFFGFRPNETYTLHMPSGGDANDVVQSLSGQRLATTISCTLNIGAIKDLNQAPPSAKMITPASTTNNELDTSIVLEFNEIIDPAIFVNITPATSPIRYSVKSAQNINGIVECRLSSEAVLLPGEPRMSINSARGTSIVTFKPKEPLPGKKCVQILVTSQVKDLAGVTAKPQVLQFTTKDVGTQIHKNREDFTSSKFLDKDLSAGTWGNGALTFSPIGGSGKHGVFDPTLGKDISDPKVKVAKYEWDLSKVGGFKIPKTHTSTGKDEYVTDGRFEFSKMEIPDGVEVHFVGSIPARIWVRGSCTIGGLLASNGESIPLGRFLKSQATGELGGKGGAMGGTGGKGGDKPDGKGVQAKFHGQVGQDVQLLNGHKYAASYVGTGGKGSTMWPADGKDASIVFSYYSIISQQSNKGGGGAGFTSPGTIGYVKWSKTANQKFAATGSTAGGKGVPFSKTFPSYTNGFTPQDHYLVGGSGGGGSGGSCGGAIKTTPANWWTAGRGGHGGGGALALRIGGDLILPPSGRVEANGGSGGKDESNFSLRGMAAGGGGGSGGSLFLQVNQSVRNQGSITAKGGSGGLMWGHISDQVYSGMKSYAGNGSNGIVHFETTQDPTSYPIGTTIPASAPVQKVRANDSDKVVTIRSLWYAASLLFPPDFKRYEIEAELDGKPVVFSDDPAKGVLATVGQPIRLKVQGAKLETDPTGKLARISNTPRTPFRDYVGTFSKTEPAMADDGATGYRFELTLDRSLGKKVVVKAITIFWEL